VSSDFPPRSPSGVTVPHAFVRFALTVICLTVAARAADTASPTTGQTARVFAPGEWQLQRCLDDVTVEKYPAELEGLTAIVTDRGDSRKPGAGPVFTVDRPATVWICVANRGRPTVPAEWGKAKLNVRWKAGEQLKADSVYVRRFEKGVVEVPQHDGMEGPDYGLPHLVFVKAEEGDQAALAITDLRVPKVISAADRLPRFDVTVAGNGREVRVVPVNVDPAGKTLRLSLGQKDEVSPMITRRIASTEVSAPLPADGATWDLDRPQPGLYSIRAQLGDGPDALVAGHPVMVDLQGRLLTDFNLRHVTDEQKGSFQLRALTAPEAYKRWKLTLTAGGKTVAESEGDMPVAPAGGGGPKGAKRKPAAAVALPAPTPGPFLATLTLSGAEGEFSVPFACSVEPEFRYAYFPSHRLVRFLLPAPPAGATDWRLTLTEDGKDTILAERSGSLPMSANGENLDVPHLREGLYLLTLTFPGGPEGLEIRRPFQRKKLPWEGLNLGMDDVVVPPFTPLEVDSQANAVSCVLRRTVMDPTGLWSQVESQQQPLLAAPVRLEFQIGGRTVTAAGKGAAFTETKPTRVTGKADWTAGEIAGATEFSWDYDGLMEVVLKLPKTPAPVEKLQLVIPLKQSEAWLLHPVTAGLRPHYAGRIPAGSGKVWDSLAAPRVGLPGTLVPYVFVGGPERGICFAADNDRDWVTDPNVPALEIHRDGDEVSLRVNLICRPVQLERERTIRFALQATPAKPMPDTPTSWRKWWNHGTGKDVEDVNFEMWGGTTYWGGALGVVDYFPHKLDFGHWERLAKYRRTGQQDPGYLQEWLAKIADKPAAIPAAKAGLEWATMSPADTPDTKKHRWILPYISPRSASLSDDGFGITYMDEWSTMDIAHPKWKAGPPHRSTRQKPLGIYYDIEPVPTVVDRLLYYHKKMYETFADGIYWDNIFLKPCWVPAEAGGPAYVNDEGKLIPGVNLMAYRALVKRHAVMMHAMGKRPLAWMHMTNFNCVPILSFSQINYDWEWRDLGNQARLDMQDRLGIDADPALVLVQSTGLQAGNVAVACDRFDPQTRRWQIRTNLAVCLPHEIKVHAGGQDNANAIKILADFGYGEPDCRVYRYWESGHPFTATGARLRALVLARGGKALLAIGNFGQGDEKPLAYQPQAADSGDIDQYDRIREQGQRAGGKPAAGGKAGKDVVYDAVFTLDLAALGLPDDVRAFDMEQRLAAGKRKPPKGKKNAAVDLEPVRPEELEQAGPGAFRLPIRRHDFALILVE
jgi:hypothetical protein